jgi:hypothetical protein
MTDGGRHILEVGRRNLEVEKDNVKGGNFMVSCVYYHKNEPNVTTDLAFRIADTIRNA